MAKLIKTFLLFFIATLSVIASERYTQESVLNEGKWVKIEITETGVYKLTNADLQKMGFSDPAKVSVFGYGGWPIDEDFSKEYIDDLPAAPIWRGNDYLLFYGRGIVRWEYDAQAKAFVHTNNPYSTKAYYFLTDRYESPKTMQTEASKGNGSGLQVTTFDDYRVHEQELISVHTSGRELYGESFEGRSSPLALNMASIPGITNADGLVTMRFIARPTVSVGNATLQLDGTEFMNIPLPIDTYPYTTAVAREKKVAWEGEKKETIDIKLSYNNTFDKNTHLDYIRLQMVRELKVYGAFTPFRNLQSRQNDTRFTVSGANEQTQIWDVTDPLDAKIMETTLNGSELIFTIEAGPLREFVIVQPEQSGFGVPVKTGDVANQNLHGLSQTDMVIIALPFMKTQAERLADLHRERDNLRVEVIDPLLIYNEFSSGTPDASSYRRLMKMFYDRGTTESEKPRFLLLFGDGIYDNRGLCVKVRDSYPSSNIHERMLLTYQSPNSVNIDSYVTDDYFGFMQDAYYTGASKYTNIQDWSMDIAIGRLPLRTEIEARQAVDKIITYLDNKEPGIWKNSLAFVGDDGNNSENFAPLYMNQSNQLAEIIETQHPQFLSHKVYFDAYKKDFSGSTTYPDVHNRIQQLLKNGLLAINYVGHGDTQSWSDEKVITLNDISTASYTHLPLWITATCDFTRFDALATSAGEQVFLNKTSGGIALFTTTRVVLAGPNFTLNKQLINHLFDKKEGKRLTLGEVMLKTKRALEGDSNKLNFILIGDPAMRLAYPDYDIEVTSVNGIPASEVTTLKALDKVTIQGEIRDFNGNLVTDFNGMVYPTVLDSKATVTTLDNNRIGETFTYTDYPNTLFIGNDKVENGKFSFTFTVPKDIAYSDDYGKMNLYAYDTETNIEAQGSFKNYKVGGTSPNPENDENGPEIRRLFLNDTTFVSGDKVNATPLFVAELWDQSGVNITGSSIGHDIMLIIDGNTSLSYNLNNYYENIPDSDGEGRVVFPVPSLSEGVHTAEFIAWDIHNNSSRDTFSFEVSPNIKPVLSKVYATPNPARDQVEFRLVHNRPETNMTVEIRVYDMSGRHLWTGQQQGSSELFKDLVLNWDLTDSSNNRLRPGVYVYRAAIKTKQSKEATEGNKLIILAQ